MLPRRFTLLFGLPLLLMSSTTLAADRGEIEALLKREIIGPGVGMAEVQNFTERRVPKMPEVNSAKEWETTADRLRQDVLDKVVFRGQAKEWRDAKTKVEFLQTIEGLDGYRIRKLRYEALPGMWIPALLYEPKKLKGKVPVVLNVNGHDRGNGKAANYKQIRCINQARRGMIALNVEWLGMGQLNVNGNVHYRMNQLDLCGTSGLAPFYLSMSRGIDILLSHENADAERVAVAGLSGGGWQTIFISSLDTRVKLANPVAGYSSFITRARHLKDLGDSEQTPCDLATIADYTHLTAMLAPRAALLTFNEKDNCCFEAPYALPPLVAAASPIYKLYGTPDRLRTHVNTDPGTHNFEQDNRQALYRMFGDHFYEKDRDYSGEEIDVASDVKTKEELQVEVPEGNATFHSLALDLSKQLSRDGDLPKGTSEIESWQQAGRKRLSELVAAKNYRCIAEKNHTDKTKDGLSVTGLRLKIGDEWTVPAVVIAPKQPKGVTIVVADDGRASAAETIAALVEKAEQVIAVDPFYFGESKIADKDWLFALLAASVGERPLGIQASQIAAVSRWAKKTHDKPVSLVAVGPRSSLFALVAAALEPAAIGRVELNDALGSLKQVIEDNQTVRDAPEQFCFGLLAEFDILQLAALTAPRPVTFLNSNDRARKELAPLHPFYKSLGSDHEPFK